MVPWGASYTLAFDVPEPWEIPGQIASGIREALASKGQPVIVQVAVDYSKRTRFTQGVVKTVLKRFPLTDKARFIGRALLRKVTG